MKEKATIYDYARMCKHFDDDCQECPVFYKQTETGLSCEEFIRNYPDKANEIILKWCKEHPTKIRQSEFLKMFPNAVTNGKGRLSICPKNLDGNYGCELKPNACGECMDNYWLAEAEENDK